MTPTPALRGWRVRGKSSCAPPSDKCSLITYADGMIVSLHTVCSQIPPSSDHSGGHTSAAAQRDGDAKQEAQRHTNTSPPRPRMDDLVRLRSGRLPVEHNKCPTVWHARQCTHARTAIGVYHPFFLLCKAFLFFCFFQAVTEASQQYVASLLE